MGVWTSEIFSQVPSGAHKVRILPSSPFKVLSVGQKVGAFKRVRRC